MNIILQVNKHKIIYILAFALLITSIGIEPTILLNLTDNKEIVNFMVAGIRSIGPILITFVTIIFIFKRSQKIKYDFTFLVIFTYVLCTVIGFHLNIGMYATVSNFENIWINNFLVLQSLSLFLLLFAMYLDDLNFNFILYSLFLFLFLIYSYFTAMALKELFSISNTFLYTSDYLTNGELFRSAVPRSSGIARIIALIAIINIILLLNYDLNKRNIYILIITFSILYFLMIILQSRTSFYTLNAITGLIFLISIRKKFWANLKILILISGLLFLIFKLFPLFKNYVSAYNIINNKLEICKQNISPFKLNKAQQELIMDKFFETTNLSNKECNLLFDSKKDLSRNLKLPVISKKFSLKNFDRGKIAKDLRYNVNTLVNDEKTLIAKLLQLENKFKVINLENIQDDFELLKKRDDQKKIILNYIKTHEDYLLTKIDQQNLIYEYFKLNNREISKIKLSKCPFVNTRLNKLLTGRICHNYIALTDVGFQIFGKGARYDRTVLKWGISNTLVYAYVSAGIIGIVFYLHIFYLLILFFLKFIKNTFQSKNQYSTKEEILGQSLIFLMIFFLIRSFVEISFGYWSVDQLIFITCLIYYKKFIFNKIEYN